MKTLVIDRSTRSTSIVLAREDGTIEPRSLGIWSDEPEAPPISFQPRDIDRLVVGTGPGSFAGIRSALAFAEGVRLGDGCALMGLTSAAAYAKQGEFVAVVGDARRGSIWVALFDGYVLLRKIFQVPREELNSAIPSDCLVCSPDDARIGELLRDLFPGRYAASAPLDAANLVKAFTANPSLLVEEPLPIYLNPAVR